MKVLRVGDMHVMVSNIGEADKLIDFIIKTAQKHEVDAIEFLGDLFHTHAVKRIEVEDFWYRAFNKIKYSNSSADDVSNSGFECRVLVGNHDQPGSKEKEQIMNALNVFKDSNQDHGGCRDIINKPTIINNIAYIPYMSDKTAFLKITHDLYEQGATKLLVAHQTFTGATYENGFYAEDSIDPELVAQDGIISGHIHKKQQIGKCDYPGTPKWDTMSDANEDKGIWIYTHNIDGSVKSKKFISTEKVVTPIYKVVVNEGDEEPKLKKNAKNYIELVGKTAWITKMKKKYKGVAQIKARPLDRKARFAKLDTGKMIKISKYLHDYFEVVDGVDKKDVGEYLREISNAE